MSRLFTLYRVLRKCDAAPPSDSTADSEHAVPASLIATLVLAVCAMGAVGYIAYEYAELFELLGGVADVLAVLGLVLGVILLVKGIIQLVNVLYMSTDTALLITMPVPPIALAVVRLANPLLGSLLICAGVLASFAAGYALAAPATAGFFAGVCLYAVLLPLFVTLVAAALVVLFMSAFRFLRSRNAMKYIGVAGSLICVIVYMGWGSLSSSADVDVGKVIGTAVGFAERYTRAIPVIPFIRSFMRTGSLASVLGALLVTALALAAFLAAAKGLYLKGAVGMQDAAASAKRLSGKALDRAYAARQPRASYRRRELLTLRRNPAYLLKNFIIAFGWPLIIVPFFLFSMKNEMSEADLQAAQADLAAIDVSLGADVVLLLTFMLVFAVVVFMSLLSDLAYSSVTREGETFAALKLLPVSFREQIRAKRDVARNVVGISSIGYLAVASAVGAALGKVPWYAVVYGLAVGIPLLYLAVDLDMIGGIRNANLHWDNEASAIRKSPKAIMIGYLLIVLVAVGLLFFNSFADEHGIPVIPFLLAAPPVLIVAAVLADRRMYAVADKRLPEL